MRSLLVAIAFGKCLKGVMGDRVMNLDKLTITREKTFYILG